METKTQSFSHQLRQRLSTVEKRDWELWTLVLVTVGILTAGFFVVLFPAVFLKQETVRLEANISPQLLLGLLVLTLMFVVYLVHKHVHIRTLRFKSVMEAWNFEISHVQLLIDPLTRAFNRSALEEVLSKEIKRVERQQGALIFLYIDVDDFKAVNTRYGHLSGDLVLAETGGLLKQCIRGSDYVIRLGGDEFLVALVDTDEPGAEVVKQRIRERVAVWNQNSPLPGFALSLSTGIQQFDGSKSFDQVLAEADSKMYREKKVHSLTKGS